MIIEKSQPIPLTVREDGSIRVKNAGLSLESVVYAYKNGECPEEIFDSFPSDEYTVADIYLVIAYYLQNREKIEKHLARREKEAKIIREKIESTPGYQERREDLKKKLLERDKRRKQAHKKD
jgi:uncharacterized protein (DUF433 family)